MWKAYVDDEMFYSDTTPLDEYKAIRPKLELEINTKNEFTFTLAPSNIVYNKIHPMKSIVTVYKEDEIWFEGIVMDGDTDFYNCVTYKCFSELMYLEMTNQIQTITIFGTIRQYIDYLLGVHNSKCLDDRRKIYVGTVTVSDVTIANKYTIIECDNTLSYINKLIETYGGYVKIRHAEDGKKYLDYLKEFTNVSTQQIEFGSNLLDYAKHYDMNGLATVYTPLGATYTEIERARREEAGEERLQYETELEELYGETRLTVSDVNGGIPYIILDSVEQYGWVEKTIIFEDCYTPEELYSAAIEYIENTQYDELSLDVKAVDLSYQNRKEIKK